MSNTTFKQFMSEYDADTLQSIATHGCASACVGGMIYYTETSELYDKYADELHEQVQQHANNVGEFPTYILDNMDTSATFKNAMVWFVAELYTQEMSEEIEE